MTPEKLKDAVRHLSKADARLGTLITQVGPCTIEVPKSFKPFHALARSIAHQQLTGKAAETIWKRFMTKFGERGIPVAERIAKARIPSLRACGFSNAKSLALKDLAQKTLEGTVPQARALHKLSDEEIIEQLTEVRGVGRWTVEMLLMFYLGRMDVLPVGDFGVRKGFSLWYDKGELVTPKELQAHAEVWAPYRSVGSWYMWRAIEILPKTKQLS